MKTHDKVESLMKKHVKLQRTLKTATETEKTIEITLGNSCKHHGNIRKYENHAKNIGKS